MRKTLILITVVVYLLLNTGCNQAPIELPQNLEHLYEYNWVIVQDQSEPDVYRFYNNRKLHIFGYSYEYICDWSVNEDEITIKSSKKEYYNGTFKAEIYTEDSITYLKLGNMLLKGTKLAQ